MKRLNSESPNKPPSRQEKDIVQILAKIKGKVVRERIRVLEFMKDYDRYQIYSADLLICRLYFQVQRTSNKSNQFP